MTITLAEKKSDTASLQPLMDLVQDDLVRVNDTITTHMQSGVDMIPQVARHVISAGGKRLRPMLTLASAKLFDYEGERHINLAACVEFIHTATLLHDDVVDESKMRRGIESANAVWGNQASVLVGDFLFSRAFQLMVADQNLKVLKILSDASATIAEGEVHQLSTTGNLETGMDDYLKVISAKTAALFSAATQIGAVVAERPENQETALYNYGHNLGMAFQLIDDMLDYSANAQELGKAVGDDFAEGKLTLPIILAYQAGSPEERKFWQRTIEHLDQREDDLMEAQQLIQQHGCLETVYTCAVEYAEKACQSLSDIQDSAIKDILIETADFATARRY